MTISATYDHEADALYIDLKTVSVVYKTIERREGNFDVDDDGNVVGIEILNPTRPLMLATVAAELGFDVRLDAIYSAANMALGTQIGGAARLTTTTAQIGEVDYAA